MMMHASTRSEMPDLLSFTRAPVLSTGLPALDRMLPGGGWPLGKPIELIGGPEVTAPLLLPVLRTLSWDDQWITLVAPPLAFIDALLHQGGTDLTRFRRQWIAQRPLRDAARAVAAGTASAVLVWTDRADARADAALRETLAGRDLLVFVLYPADVRLPATGPLRLAVGATPAGSLSVRRLVDPEDDRLMLDPAGLPTTPWFATPGHQAAVTP